MLHVKRLARRGITICSTIHSPTAFCFNLFDRLILLLRGRVIYFGQNGAAALKPMAAHSMFVAWCTHQHTIQARLQHLNAP